uniref:Uncharacterized protein n=1 Tax=Oryza punctata TaxID=4537 RepID=A0A0E0K907_ORYPU
MVLESYDLYELWPCRRGQPVPNATATTDDHRRLRTGNQRKRPCASATSPHQHPYPTPPPSSTPPTTRAWIWWWTTSSSSPAQIWWLADGYKGKSTPRSMAGGPKVAALLPNRT